ncbi:antibiotic biosynthesis monooxygenase family protein [Streptomyces sp. NPDC005828]|uniref:antibiotic biosynthesis monooxygenase family protein n=1 Tax=Streptomyces sp. NPDC005828 TaxID=3157071 RepID=UPI0033D337B7
MAEYAQGPVRVVLRMEIAPGREAEFEAVWLEIGTIIARQPANRGQVLVRDEDQDRPVYHVFTDWADEASFRAFELSAEHVEHRRRLAPLRTGGAMTVHRIVHDLRPAPASSHT